MIITYDIEVLKYDWIMVFKEGEDYRVIHNNKKELEAYIDSLNKSKAILVGFNNYHYDDVVLAGVLLGKDPYEISKKLIVDNERVNYKLNMITLDVIQELPLGVGLKSSQANLGMSIVETPIDFNLDRPCTKEELELLIKYCKNDVKDTELLFKKRADYFQAKFEIVNEFGLDIPNVKKTRAILASKVLQCQKTDIPRDRLHIDYDPNINWDIIPNEIQDFFKKCEYDYRCGGDYKEIETRKLKLNVAGVPHVYAFGGIHGAIEKYNESGNFLHIDVSSYYPSLIIVDNYMSRASKEPQTFTHLRDMRYKLKAQKDPKNKIYKILINATFGAMKSEYNMLFDPKQANNICINGQIILTQLILELKDYCQLIQSNTDGLVVKYDPKNYQTIVDIVTDFGKRFGLTFDIDKIIKIAQRDVNNYAIQFEDGHIEAKGRFSKFEGGNYMQNSLTIIDRALVNYYIFGKSVADTVIETYKNNDLAPFQIVCKMGSTYNGMYYEYGEEGDTKLIPTQKVNRVFATNNKKYWGIYKRKGDSYQKIANTSEHNIIHNGDIKEFDKSKLDLNYYINLCKKNLY
ncbi:MAG: DNA polymerase B [Bacilli bacterium]|nr:DNA polymerase B [Bacilli bacterium]